MIRVLSPEDAAKLAATEIVERPESVVKECIENSLDAGASEIKVRVLGGGLELIEIQDNGEGIREDEIELAVQRFATSKIQSYSDLSSLKTFGFRGEALYAINQVSNLEISSRHQTAEVGAKLTWRYGSFVSRETVSRGFGTTVRVESLFSNVPARLKSQGSSIGEKKRIRSLVRAYALVKWDCGFTLETESFVDHYPAGDFRVYEIFGAELSRISSTYAYVEVEGYLGLRSLGANGEFFIFVNGRPVMDKLITKAVRDRLAGLAKSDRDFAGYLNVIISPAFVDFNVHPRKLEVRFLDNSLIYKAVYKAIDPQRLLPKSWVFTQFSNSRLGFSKQDSHSLGGTHSVESSPDIAERFVPTEASTVDSFVKARSEKGLDQPLSDKLAVKESDSAQHVNSTQSKSRLFGNGIRARFLGTFGPGYFVYIVLGVQDQSEQILIIDPHAARERELFNKILPQLTSRPSSQTLLFPLAVDSELSQETISELEKIGFQISVDQGVKISALPTVVYELFKGSLYQVVDMIQEFDSVEFTLEKFAYALAARAACRASYMLGDAVSESEAICFLERVLELEQVYCPHGRPFMFKLDRRSVDEFFARRA